MTQRNIIASNLNELWMPWWNFIQNHKEIQSRHSHMKKNCTRNQKKEPQRKPATATPNGALLWGRFHLRFGMEVVREIEKRGSRLVDLESQITERKKRNPRLVFYKQLHPYWILLILLLYNGICKLCLCGFIRYFLVCLASQVSSSSVGFEGVSSPKVWVFGWIFPGKTSWGPGGDVGQNQVPVLGRAKALNYGLVQSEG